MLAKKHKRDHKDDAEKKKRREAIEKHIAECAAKVVKDYPKHARLIDWLGGPERAFPNPISKASMRLLRVKHHNDEAERLVQYTFVLLGGHNLSDGDPVDSINAWMDALETWWNIEEAVDLFVKMMRILEKTYGSV